MCLLEPLHDAGQRLGVDRGIPDHGSLALCRLHHTGRDRRRTCVAETEKEHGRAATTATVCRAEALLMNAMMLPRRGRYEVSSCVPYCSAGRATTCAASAAGRPPAGFRADRRA